MNNDGCEKLNRYEESYFNWQNDCISKIQDFQNVILSSPTGSGKTKVFLEWAKKKQSKPIIITAPIKALSNQRYRELLAEGYIVGLETGDIENVPEDCDFICCAQEIYTNKYTELKNVTLIIDEFHYIFENSNRARTYIDALKNSKANNILLCSATLGDINKLLEYVNRLSEREFFAYKNDSRLTSLIFKGDIDISSIKNSLIVTFSKKNIESILNLLAESRKVQNKSIITDINNLAKNDNIDNYELVKFAHKGIVGYYGALLPKEKLFIEKCFEKGLIDTVIGTDALALGVNFPVENVIFAQLAKYYDGPISRNLFEQLAGRAGRKGYFDKGYVYYCSEFASEMEAWGYNTRKLFKKILNKTNEDISIKLTPNIKNILLGRTTIRKEAEFISEFSTEKVDVKCIFERISNIIEYISNYSFEQEIERIADEGLKDEGEDNEEKRILKKEFLRKKEEFAQNIAKVYFDEYSPETNCRIFADILCGIEPDEVLEKYGLSGGFYDMLQFRKYVKALPRQYRRGLTKINDKIREIDETAIDGFRGSVSVEEVSKELEKEGKYTKRSIMKVLNNHGLFQKVTENVEKGEK